MNTHLKNAMFGRPTKYSQAVIKETREYLNLCVQNDDCPFAEELALILGVHDSTLWHWSKNHDEFNNLYEMLFTLQKLVLKKKGLSGEYVSKAACLLLSADHGVSLKRKMELDAKIVEEKPINLTPEQRSLYSEAITKIFEQIYSQPAVVY